jgi:CheY-like chemotaxis protein
MVRSAGAADDLSVTAAFDLVVQSPTSCGTERLLVVEDEATVRRLVVTMLESYGYEVAEAPNMEQALALCAAERFDLMVTDMVMPGGDGSMLARAAVTHQPDLRVLYTSAYTPESIPRLELEGTETAFLGKPFTAEVLARTVRLLLD